MPAFLHVANPFANRHDILPALRSAQIELIHRIQILRSFRIELGRQVPEKFLDAGNVHGWESQRMVGHGSGGSAAPSVVCSISSEASRLRSTAALRRTAS